MQVNIQAQRTNLIESTVDDSVTSGVNYFTYQGIWANGPNPVCFENTEHYTTPVLPGANWSELKPSLTLTFEGVKAELYGQKHDGLGIYEIEVDGKKVANVDAYQGDGMHNKELLFATDELEDGPHTITMRMTNTKNAASRREDGHIDFAKVYAQEQAATAVTITETDSTLSAGETKQLHAMVTPQNGTHDGFVWSSSNPNVASIDENGLVKANSNGTTNIKVTLKNTNLTDQIAMNVTGNDITKYVSVVDDLGISEGFTFEYENTWAFDSGYPELFFNGTNHYSTTAQQNGKPAIASLRFVGSGIELYGNLQNSQGIYNIYIDDELVATKDAYASSRLTKQLIFEKKDLKEEEHMLKVVTSDAKNPASSGTDISIDRALVYHDEIPADDFQITQTNLTLDTNTSFELHTVFTPTYATLANITWKSSNEEVASVDEHGVITAKKVGKVEISGTLENGSVRTAVVNVIDGDNKLHAMFGNTNIHYLQKDYEAIVKKYNYESTKFNTDLGWKHDQINAEIVSFTKDEAVHNVTFTPQDFTNEAGVIFPKEQISIKFLKETSVGEGRADAMAESNHTDIPDIIYNADPKDIEENRIQNAWMSIDIPKDAKAGTYHGVIEIKGDDMETISLPYSFDVINLEQPDVKDYQGGVELWEYPYAVAKYYNIPDSELYGERHIQLLTQNLKEYAAMGGNTITTAVTDYPWDRNNPYDYPSTIQWTRKADGTFVFDYTQFDKWVQLNVDLGISDKLKCFSMAPYHAMRYYDEAQGNIVEENLNVGSARWNDVWGQFLTSFIPHLDEKGWFDMTYTAMDEVGQGAINAVYELVQKYPNKDGKSMKVSAAVNYGGTTQETLDRVNDISLALSHTGNKAEAQEIANTRREKGLYTSFYTCTGIYPNSFALSDPGESAWTFWYNASTQMDGYLRWAYDNWLSDPYPNLDWKFWEAGDTMLIYPDEDRNATNPEIKLTPRWQKMKEGKRDIEKMYYLRDNFEFLSEDVKAALESVAIGNGAINSTGGMYADSQATKDMISAEVTRMRERLGALSQQAADSKIKNYELSITKNIEEAGSVSGAGVYKENSNVSVSATANEGYQFVNWISNGNVVSSDAVYVLNVRENTKLVANFKKVEEVKETFSVTFLDFYGETLHVDVVEKGKDAKAPEAPIVEGYTFDKWDTDYKNVQKNLTIKAMYTKNTSTGDGTQETPSDDKDETIKDDKEGTIKDDKVPDTGDTTSPTMFIVFGVVALLTMGAIYIIKKKKTM